MRGVKTLKLELISTEKDGAKAGGAMIYNEGNYFKLLRVISPKSSEESFMS